MSVSLGPWLPPPASVCESAKWVQEEVVEGVGKCSVNCDVLARAIPQGTNPAPVQVVLTGEAPCLACGGRNYTGTCLGGLQEGEWGLPPSRRPPETC